MVSCSTRDPDSKTQHKKARRVLSPIEDSEVSAERTTPEMLPRLSW